MEDCSLNQSNVLLVLIAFSLCTHLACSPTWGSDLIWEEYLAVELLQQHRLAERRVMSEEPPFTLSILELRLW